MALDPINPPKDTYFTENIEAKSQKKYSVALIALGAISALVALTALYVIKGQLNSQWLHSLGTIGMNGVYALGGVSAAGIVLGIVGFVYYKHGFNKDVIVFAEDEDAKAYTSLLRPREFLIYTTQKAINEACPEQKASEEEKKADENDPPQDIENNQPPEEKLPSLFDDKPVINLVYLDQNLQLNVIRKDTEENIQELLQYSMKEISFETLKSRKETLSKVAPLFQLNPFKSAFLRETKSIESELAQKELIKKSACITGLALGILFIIVGSLTANAVFRHYNNLQFLNSLGTLGNKGVYALLGGGIALSGVSLLVHYKFHYKKVPAYTASIDAFIGFVRPGEFVYTEEGAKKKIHFLDDKGQFASLTIPEEMSLINNQQSQLKHLTLNKLEKRQAKWKALKPSLGKEVEQEA